MKNKTALAVICLLGLAVGASAQNATQDKSGNLKKIDIVKLNLQKPINGEKLTRHSVTPSQEEAEELLKKYQLTKSANKHVLKEAGLTQEQFNTIVKKAQQARAKQAKKAKSASKTQDSSAAKVAGREGNMMNLGNTVSDVVKKCKEAFCSKSKQKQTQPEPKDAIIKHLSEPGRLLPL